jgi:hypothetical protein
VCRCALSLCLCLSLSVYLSVHVSRHVSSLSVSVCLPLSTCVCARVRAISVSLPLTVCKYSSSTTGLLGRCSCGTGRGQKTLTTRDAAPKRTPQGMYPPPHMACLSSSFTDTARKRTLQGRPHSCTRGGYICMYPPPLLTQAYAPREGTQLRALACILLLY